MGQRWFSGLYFSTSLLEIMRSKIWKIRWSPAFLPSLPSVPTSYHPQKGATRSPKITTAFPLGKMGMTHSTCRVTNIQTDLQLKDSPVSSVSTRDSSKYKKSKDDNLLS